MHLTGKFLDTKTHGEIFGEMEDIDIVIVDYFRKGNAAKIAQDCKEHFLKLGVTPMIHILRPPEAETPMYDFPEDARFWHLDRNHGAQQRYSLAGEVQSEWSFYPDNDLLPTFEGIQKLVDAARTHGNDYSCYGWFGHNISNVRAGHIQEAELEGREVDFALRAYLYRSENVKFALLDFPIFHWEDDLNMQIKIQKRLQRPSWIVNAQDNFTNLGGAEDYAHHRQPGHFDSRQEMVSQVSSYIRQATA